MKRTMTYPIVLVLAAFGLLSFTPGDDSEMIHLKVTKKDNGKTTVLQKTYSSMEALKSDEELKKFDVLLEKWSTEVGDGQEFQFNSSDDAKNVLIMRNPGNKTMTWVSESGDSTRVEKKIIIKQKDGEVEKTIHENKEIRVIPGDGKKEIIIHMDSDDDGEKSWTDENGNVLKLKGGADDEKVMVIDTAGAKKFIIKKDSKDDEQTWTDENGNVLKLKGGAGDEKVIVIDTAGAKKFIIKRDSKDDEQTWTDDKGNVLKLNDDSKDKKVIVIIGDDADNDQEMEVDVETIEGAEGTQKTITKKVWVTTDGNKTDFNGKDMEIITKGDTFNIRIDHMDDGPMAMGDKVMMIKSLDKEGPGETMDVNIKNEGGEQFIEINIKRTSSSNITISDIAANDVSFKDAGVPLKSNLATSSFNYFPNPNSGRFSLKFSLDQKDPVSVKVLDINGGAIYSETVKDFNGNYDNEIDLNSRSNGIYILQISQKKKTLTKKIVIE